MATEDCKDLLTSGSQPEDVGSDFYDDVNIKAATASEKKGEDFLTALEDDKTDGRVKNGGVKNDKKAEEANVNTDGTSTVSNMTVELSTSMVDGHEKADERDEKDVENDKKAEAVNSSSNKETKKVVRKRKNAEEASVLTVSSPPKMVKKKMNDISATKMKEAPPRDKSIEGNEKNEVKSDEKLESIVKGAIPEDEKKEADMTDVKVVKKAEGTAKKTVKIAKKKIVAKAKGGSSNAESAPTKSASVAEVAAPSGMDKNAKQNVKNLASEEKNVIPAVEKKDVEGTKDNSNETETLDEKVAISSSIDADKVNDADKPTPSAGEKRSKMADTAEKQLKHVDGMGLIFMCNAKTKKDCFKYNILGLPESKKELVAKIYKGMRLFLFDFDLKLLYGIYKAASPGGYNIEPKAFDSKFPSQVRFVVLRDCLPLPEEKFKEAMKENYYKRSKFNCQLSAEQVKNLCKLFQSATGTASQQNHRAGNAREVPMQRSSASELKRRRVGRDHPRNERYGREAYPSPPPRVRYLSPPPRALPLHTYHRALPSTLPSYALERPADDYYSRGHHRVLDLEMRPRDPPMDYQDPYILYREPGLYSEPLYQPSLPPAYAARLREPRSPPRYPY